MICPECNGTGEYRGLNVVEPCKACGGKQITHKGHRGKLIELTEMDILTHTPTVKNHSVSDVCQQFAVPLITLEYQIRAPQQIKVSGNVDTVERCEGNQLKHVPVRQHMHMRVNDVDAGLHDYTELLTTGRQINVRLKTGDITQNIEDVRLLSYELGQFGRINVEFEWTREYS